MTRASCLFLTLLLVAGSLAAQEVIETRPVAGETEHFEFDAPIGHESADMGALGAQFEEIFDVVAERLGVSSDPLIRLTFAPPDTGPCRSRGLAMVLPEGTDPAAVIRISADENASSEQIQGALAHEVGHVLQRVAVSEGQTNWGSMLIEGFASWAAGPYWLQWQGAASFESAVTSYIAAGTYIPLTGDRTLHDTYSDDAASRFGDDCLNRRDIIYMEWAAFVEYLVEEYGRARLYSLFRTPPAGSAADAESPRPNFIRVYGSSLEQLEAAWLDNVRSSD